MRKNLVCKVLMGMATCAALVLSACSGTKADDPAALDNALAGFTSCVQSSRWQEALTYVTPDEADEIGTSDGYEFKEEYTLAARRLPLSTLRKAGLSVDSEGRLIGIKKAMDEANSRSVMSAEQAKVGTNMKEMEDARIKRRLEEGQKIMQEEEEAANQPQEEIVYSNKLTDEEKRKYGSTRDLQAPEEMNDENTQEADQDLYGSESSEYSSEE